MVVHIRKKKTRRRGSHTHGWGSKKKHRGAGNRGGRGMAGSGKRADQRKPSILKEYGNTYFGKRGFYKHNAKSVKAVNISYLEEHLPNLIAKKLINEENSKYVVDLKALGYNKLLGSGKVTKKFVITAEAASKKVIERVKKAGGEVLLPSETVKG